jgi:hypothetical protein
MPTRVLLPCVNPETEIGLGLALGYASTLHTSGVRTGLTALCTNAGGRAYCVCMNVNTTISQFSLECCGSKR